MGCAAEVQGLLDSIQPDVDDTKNAAMGKLEELRNIVPAPGELREAFEDRKNSLMAVSKGLIDTYNDKINDFNLQGEVLGRWDAAVAEQIENYKDRLQQILSGSFAQTWPISLTGLGVAALNTAITEIEKNIQCSTLPTVPDLPELPVPADFGGKVWPPLFP